MAFFQQHLQPAERLLMTCAKMLFFELFYAAKNHSYACNAQLTHKFTLKHVNKI